MKISPKLQIAAVALVIILGIMYGLIVTGQRLGKTAVDIQVLPKNSEVTVNGVEYENGKTYLKPGTYEFVAKYPDFSDAKKTVTITKESAEVILLPEPNTEAANELLKNNPDLQRQREALGGREANLKGLEQEKKTPIITLLPYSDLTAPFSIDYGPSEYRKDDVVIIISNSTPDGRDYALRWIRQQGYDPANLEIVFDDFVNPLTQNTEELSNAD